MRKTPYLVKRGNMFWWRRRMPVFTFAQGPCGTRTSCPKTDGIATKAPRHVAVSLRTSCPKEAGRRAARMTLLFEEQKRGIETALSGVERMSDERYIDRAMADMAATLRAQAEMMARQMVSVAPPASVAPIALAAPPAPVAKIAPEASARELDLPPTLPHAPQRASTATPVAQTPSILDDPEFERALLDMADRGGWWHEDPDDIIAQFDMLLTGLFVLQEEYLHYCVRKGLDPAKALPCLASLESTLSATTDDILANSTTSKALVPTATTRPATGTRTGGRKIHDGSRFSSHARRYLDLRSEGYDLLRRNETPDTLAGKRFTKTSRGNFESTIRLFIEAHGDIFVENIDEAVMTEFFTLLDRIPAQHGKSSKDRRPVRQVVKETDRDERNQITRREAQMQRDGASPGQIEEALDALRVRRLRTNTCKRHMDAMDHILGFAQFEGLREDNPAKSVKWTHKEIARRLAHEEDADRLPWGDRLPGLLASPIYRNPLQEAGDPLFWAPLLGLFAGFRMEEALQLRTDDFDTVDGVPVVKVVILGALQSRKSKATKRSIPLHDSLVDLGLLKLVQLRRSANLGRLFTHLERGQAKGTFAEIFSKRFTHYRKKCDIYDPARDFHSLRKDFQTKLTRANVPFHSRQLLMGHKLSDVTHKHYYPENDTIEMMRDFVNRIDVDCTRILRPFQSEADTNILRLTAKKTTEHDAWAKRTQ